MKKTRKSFIIFLVTISLLVLSVVGMVIILKVKHSLAPKKYIHSEIEFFSNYCQNDLSGLYHGDFYCFRMEMSVEAYNGLWHDLVEKGWERTDDEFYEECLEQLGNAENMGAYKEFENECKWLKDIWQYSVTIGKKFLWHTEHGTHYDEIVFSFKKDGKYIVYYCYNDRF